MSCTHLANFRALVLLLEEDTVDTSTLLMHLKKKLAVIGA
jgi:hypothetical protein